MIFANAADAATLTASPVMESSLPVTNLQLQEGAFVARSTSTADQTIKFDFSDLRLSDNDMFVLLGDFSDEAEVQMTLYAGANQTGDIVYTTTTTVWKAIPWEEFGPWGTYEWGGGKIYEVAGSDPAFIQAPIDDGATGLTYLSGQFIVVDPNNPDGYHNLKRLFIGELLQPRLNFDFGHSLYVEDESEQEPDDGGGLISFHVEPSRRLQFTLSHMSDAEFSAFWRGINYARKVNDVFIEARPAANGILWAAHTMRAKFTSLPKFSSAYAGHWQAPFELREVK